MKFNTVLFKKGANTATTVNGDPIPADCVTRASAQCSVTGPSAISATLKLQGSNDPPQNGGAGPAPTNWSDIASATVSVNAASVFATPITECCYTWIRAVWTFTSQTGGGTFTSYVHTQGYGQG